MIKWFLNWVNFYNKNNCMGLMLKKILNVRFIFSFLKWDKVFLYNSMYFIFI